jgi:CheY-like chemotaxis protein
VPQKIITSDQPPERFILLADDDPDDHDMLKEVFASIDTSYALFFVNNGKELFSAMDKFRDEHLPCLIVLDYNLPGLNGADVLKEINSHPRYINVPKIVWSTSGSDKYRNICLELGAADYVIKPSNIQELEKIARYMLSLC